MSPLAVLVLSVGIFFLRFAQWYLFCGRRLGQKYIGSADTWWFLMDARKIREGNFRFCSRYRENMLEAEKYYPPIFLYLLTIIPEKCVKFMLKYASALTDALFASALFSSIALATNNLEYGFLGAIVYFSSPMMFQQNYSLCVRPLSIFLVSLIYLLSYQFSILNFLGIALLTSVALLLHKFATQIIFFLSLGFLLIGRPDYLLSVSVGFLISTLVSKGYYLKILRAHINIFKSDELKHFLQKSTKSPLQRTVALTIYFPWLLFFAISIAVMYPNVFSNFPVHTFTWIMTLTILSIITNFGTLRVIGEGWRYLGYLAFPMSFYVVSVIGYSPILLWMYIFFAFSGLVIGYYYTQRIYRAHQKYLIDEEDINIFKKISSIEGKEVITYPFEFTAAAGYFSKKDHDHAEREYDIKLRHADVLAVNKEFAEKALFITVDERHYSKRFEEGKWIVYVH